MHTYAKISTPTLPAAAMCFSIALALAAGGCGYGAQTSGSGDTAQRRLGPKPDNAPIAPPKYVHSETDKEEESSEVKSTDVKPQAGADAHMARESAAAPASEMDEGRAGATPVGPPAKRKAARAGNIYDLLDTAVGGAGGAQTSTHKKMSGAAGSRGTLGHGKLSLHGSGYGGGGVGHGGRGLHSPAAPPRHENFNREGYEHKADNEFIAVADQPLSTFSADVDTASYSNVRRYLTQHNSAPPKDAVRIEEMVNYFSYGYGAPTGELPFKVHAEVSESPWNKKTRLVHVGVKAREIPAAKVAGRNLVFLIDVSGSMSSHNKLPLLKQGMAMLARQVREQDRVAIVVYAGSSGLVLEPTNNQNQILSALERLQAGGSTNGAAGIALAYQVAQRNFIKGGINRVILATDGDFNVGVSSDGGLERLIAQKRKTGVFLTVLGFGHGNYQEHKMETLADKGNGNFAYIDSAREAKKVLVREAGSTLVTVAKDVKFQIEFNPARIKSYRLIGYENRLLAAQDFNNDKKDAGEVGAGHTVTVLYEVELADGEPTRSAKVDPLKYQGGRQPTAASTSDEILTVKVRYKPPQGDKSRLFTQALRDPGTKIMSTSNAFRFSAAVAAYAQKLRGNDHVSKLSFASIRELAAGAMGPDEHGDRREFLTLVDRSAGQDDRPGQSALVGMR